MLRSFAVACATLVLATLPVSANPAGSMARQPGVAPLTIAVQGRACRACRIDCDVTYRRQCGYSQSCRRGFTLCMRGCWEDYCR